MLAMTAVKRDVLVVFFLLKTFLATHLDPDFRRHFLKHLNNIFTKWNATNKFLTSSHNLQSQVEKNPTNNMPTPLASLL